MEFAWRFQINMWRGLNWAMLCRELGIGIVPYSPLGRGFFAGYKPEETQGTDVRKVLKLILPLVYTHHSSVWGIFWA